jgi:hypothetical protein
MRIASSLIALLLLSVASADEPVKVAPTKTKLLSSQNGRYVFGQISDFRSDQFLLDTATGRLWRIVLRKFKKSGGATDLAEGYTILEPVAFVDEEGNEVLEPK